MYPWRRTDDDMQFAWNIKWPQTYFYYFVFIYYYTYTNILYHDIYLYRHIWVEKRSSFLSKIHIFNFITHILSCIIGISSFKLYYSDTIFISKIHFLCRAQCPLYGAHPASGGPSLKNTL